MDIQKCIENAVSASLAGLLEHVGGKELAGLLEAMARLELLKKKPLLTPADVSALYGIPTATLATWRSRALGPDYVKAEGSVFYTHQQMERWIARNEVKLKDRR